MKFSRLFTFALISAVGFNFADAQQTDFFWSFQDLNQGAVNAPVEAEFQEGDTGSLFLYYTTNGSAASDMKIGALLDIQTSDNGVIRFTRAETYDFEITVVTTPIGNRWTNTVGSGGAVGETGTVSDDFISEFGAFTITGGPGIIYSKVFLDQGYDASADAFLFARVDFEVIGQVGDSTQIIASAGDGLVVNGHDCDAEVVNARFGCATIQVNNPALCIDLGPSQCFVDLPPTGDVNGDGSTDLLDVAPFIDLLISGQYLYDADINQDQAVDLLDVNGFVALIVGQEPGKPELGDINCDGRINLLDAPCMFAILAGETKACDFSTADITQDGSIDLLDVQPLIDIILEQE